MDHDFWLTRWQNNQIGFHEGTANTLLTAHLAALRLPPGARIFVPLCGKTQDMAWLRAQGFTLCGAELSRLAIEQFFAELGITPLITHTGALECFEAAGVKIFAGDIFALDAATLGPVDAIYDRAALVALPPPLRQTYAAHLIALTNNAPQLLITLEYDQTKLAGPPFSVPGREVEALYASYRLTCVETRAAAGGLKGVPAQESAWLLQRR